MYMGYTYEYIVDYSNVEVIPLADILNLIIQIIPYALGAAVSPVVLTGVILIFSLTKKPKLPLFAFYLGSVTLLLLVVVFGILIGLGVVSTGSNTHATKMSIDLVIGAIIIILGFRSFIIRDQDNEGGIFKYMKPSEDAGTLSIFSKFYLVGFLLFLFNSSTDVLVLAAGKEMGLAYTGPLAVVAATIILTIITLLVVEIPIALYLIMPDRFQETLKPLNEWIAKNGHYISGLILLILGGYLLIKGWLDWVFFNFSRLVHGLSKLSELPHASDGGFLL